MNVAQVPAQHVDRVWPMVGAFIASALRHSAGHMRVEDVRAEVARGNRQLWIASEGGPIRAVCVTRIAQYPATRALWVQESAGTLGAVQHFWPHLVEFGKEWGCETVCFMGRRGWSKSGVLPPEFKHMSDFWVAEL